MAKSSPKRTRDLLKAGREAVARRAWDEARTAFEAAVLAEETPEALEGLADAAWWLNDEAAVFDARERAYRLHQQFGNPAAASRMAMWLATDSVEFRGEPAVANGWIQRAHRLLTGLERQAAHGWLAAYEGHLALMMENDTNTARRLGAEASAAGRAFADVNLEMLGSAVQGLALVSEGRIAEGTRLLDEAAAAGIAGEMSDVNVAAWTMCYLMDGYSRVRDYDRAAQWCGRVREWTRAQNFEAIFSVCRPLYAVVLMWRGEWVAAEEELTAAVREVAAFRAPMVAESIVRLAELRWRQGRWDEAASLFAQVEGEGLAQVGRSELALSQGDGATAVDLCERFLRRIPREDKIERVSGLELMARSAISIGERESARVALAELRSTAADVGTDSLRASASLVEGLLASAEGAPDSARRLLEDAVDLFERSHAPFEAARSRMELAAVFARMGRTDVAGREAAAARQAFERLGAAKEAERARSLLAGLVATEPGAARIDGLTSREIDVLRLIAAGRSNQEIAKELVLSVRTVERHTSNIYEKIGADGKVARAAATAYAIRHGLA